MIDTGQSRYAESNAPLLCAPAHRCDTSAAESTTEAPVADEEELVEHAPSVEEPPTDQESGRSPEDTPVHKGPPPARRTLHAL